MARFMNPGNKDSLILQNRGGFLGCDFQRGWSVNPRLRVATRWKEKTDRC